MTTTVKIEAHCASTKEVAITIATDSGNMEVVIQDGEHYETYAYDERVISVQERLKKG